MASRFKLNDRVRWNPETTKVPGGIGTVKGVATAELPVAGHQMIVEVDDAAGLAALGYPYSSVVISECSLTSA